MDQRKQDILNIIIESYIDSPVPVGSRTISKDFNLSVSSATIRNEMSDLEDLGFLEKPHTSAGRIPSENAYRFYVDELIPQIDSQDSLVNHFIDAMPEKLMGTEAFYRSAIEALADQTNSLALMMMPKRGDRRIKYLDLIPVSSHMVMLIVVGDRGVVVKRVLPVTFSITEDEIEYIADILYKAFVGTSFNEIDGVKFVLSGHLVRYENFVLAATEILSEVVQVVDDLAVVTSSVGNLFRYEEFKDVVRLHDLMTYIENKSNLAHLFKNMTETPSVEFRIGSENEAAAMQQNSLLSRVYPMHSSTWGKVALIGPVRMDYKKSANALVAFTDALEMCLGKNS